MLCCSLYSWERNTVLDTASCTLNKDLLELCLALSMFKPLKVQAFYHLLVNRITVEERKQSRYNPTFCVPYCFCASYVLKWVFLSHISSTTHTFLLPWDEKTNFSKMLCVCILKNSYSSVHRKRCYACLLVNSTERVSLSGCNSILTEVNGKTSLERDQALNTHNFH